MGFLHHANYFTFFEIGRTELLRASGGSYRKMEEEGLRVVVVRAECRFHRPAHYDDVLRLRTTIRRVTLVKIEHEYRLFRGAELLRWERHAGGARPRWPGAAGAGLAGVAGAVRIGVPAKACRTDHEVGPHCWWGTSPWACRGVILEGSFAGRLVQRLERLVHTQKVRGSIPLPPTSFPIGGCHRVVSSMVRAGAGQSTHGERSCQDSV